MTVHTIARLTDPAEIRAFLLTDENYAAYALGDLDSPYAEHATWFAAVGQKGIEALALNYTGLDPQALFLIGQPSAISSLLAHGIEPRQVYYTSKPDIETLLRQFYDLPREPHLMMRMRAYAFDFRPPGRASGFSPPTPLDIGHTEDVDGLLRASSRMDGREWHDVAFAPDMLASGYYFGIYEQGSLIASAGTHLVAPREGVAAVGNVVVHPEWRGRGLAQQVCGAVTGALLRAGIRMIVLNVREDNAPAFAAYRKLGYVDTGRFIEGIAVRHSTPRIGEV